MLNGPKGEGFKGCIYYIYINKSFLNQSTSYCSFFVVKISTEWWL